jgi:hypothetical protein
MRLLCAALFAALAGVAQTTTGTLLGTVVPAGATVTVTDVSRGFARSVVAGPEGLYRISGLVPGRYEVKVTAAQFQPASTRAEVNADGHLQLNFDLQANTTIEIRETLKAVDPESPALGFTLDRDRIEKLPLNRRDFLQLALLLPGVMPPVQGSELSTGGSFAMNAGGAREEFNNFTLDGADNNDPYINRFVLQPSLESVREFKILTNSYSAEYGRSAGAQVNVVTRGGSNDFHGSAYEYLRNRVLDARNYFDGARRPGYTRNQFGGTLGGPVRKDRAFFFVNYEALRERRVFTRLAVTPTPAERAGDLSARSQPVIDPFTQRPFPGNQIPAARINPLALRVLDLYNRPVVPQLRDGSHNLISRYDQNFGGRDTLTVRYGWGLQNLLEPFAQDTTDVPGFGNYSGNHGHNLAVQHQRVWSAAVVQTTRVAYNRSFRNSRPFNSDTNVGQLWGVNWLNVTPRSYGYPTIKVTGYSQVGDSDNLPLETRSGIFQVHEAVAVQRGGHALRAGGEYRHIATDGYLDYFGRGSLTFSGALTGSPIGDLLLGLPSFGLQAKFDNRQSLRTSAYNFFAQDDWRITPHLSLSFGLRYEYNTPPVDPEDRMYIFNPATAKLSRVGTDGFSRSGLRPDRNNLAPRTGFAWTPRQGWVVRGGYGLFYDSSILVINSSLYFNPPLFNVRAYFPTATSLITLNDPFPATGGITPPASPNTISPEIVAASLHQWNWTVERQLSNSMTLTAAYAGSKGTHLIRSRDLNQARPGPGNVALRRPNPAYGGIFFSESSGNSNYHSMQWNLDRRFAGGLSVMTSYTWSKSIDDTSAFLGTKPDKNFPQDSMNYRGERALSSFDMRHRFVTAGLWAWHGFEFRGIFTAQTGQPVTPLLRLDNSNTGNSGNIFGNDRPNVLRDSRLDTRTPERWFDTSAFAIPQPYNFGNAGRNIITGPGYVNLDAGIARRFRVTERVFVTLDAQAFNLSNTVHFDMPERYADEPALFGRILSAKAPRQVQFGLRLGF